MSRLRHAGAAGTCLCCTPSMSRRQFLCTTAAGAVAASATVAAAAAPANAQQPAGGPGRPILIKGGCVLSLDRAVGDFEQADVLIEGGKISAVRPNISAPNAEIIDASRMIVAPGFVDTHRHMWQGILRNVLPDGSLDDYIATVQKVFGANYTPDDVYAGDYFSALGAIDSGVTCVLDWSHIHNTPAHTDAAVKALKDSGVRAVFAYGNAQTADGRWWEAKGSKFPDDIARLRKQYFSSDDQLVTLYLAAPSGSPEEILPTFKAARDVGARITIHVGVGERGRSGLLEKLERGECAEIGHHVHPLLHAQRHRVEADQGHRRHGLDRRLRRDPDGPRQSADPEGDRHRHPALAERRRRDLGAERLLRADAHGLLAAEERGLGRRLAGDKNPPKFLTVREVLEFATIEGARANGLERKIGTLTPGKEADIILLRTDRLNVMPMNNAVGAVVTSMGPQNVDTVLIAGKVMKRNGQLVGVDFERLNRIGNEARDRLYANAKVKNTRI